MSFLYMLMDPTYILVIIALILTIIAQIQVKSTYSKYSRFSNSRGLTAEEAARMVLNYYGVEGVKIARISGDLTDNFNPRTNIISLSDSVAGSRSIAAIGVACHEAGHAAQYAQGYVPIKIRNFIIPICNIGSSLAFPIALLGVILNSTNMIEVGVILYSLLTVFQFLTLPVEFNASHRALKVMEEADILSEEEHTGAKKVLAAAAMTYVAAMAASLINLFRFALIFLGGRRDD